MPDGPPMHLHPSREKFFVLFLYDELAVKYLHIDDLSIFTAAFDAIALKSLNKVLDIGAFAHLHIHQYAEDG